MANKSGQPFLAITGIAGIIITIVLVFSLILLASVNQTQQPCDQMGNLRYQDLPARCLKEYRP